MLTEFKKTCLEGKIDEVNKYIEKGAISKYKLAFYGFEGACEGGHLDIVKLMIAHGADDWNHGLTYACISGNKEIINLIIYNGANFWYFYV